MEYKYLDINDLTKKKYHKNSKNKLFLKLIILTILIIITIAIIWMFFGEIDVVIKTNGIIKFRDNISSVYNIEGGILEDIIDKNKGNIKKGELLFRIRNSSLVKRKEYVKGKINDNKQEIKDLKNIILFLKEKQDISETNIKLLGNRYINIKNRLKNLREGIDFKRNELNVIKKFINVSISERDYKNEKRRLKELKYKYKSYKSGKILEIEDKIAEKEDNIFKKKIELESINSKISNYKITSPISGKVQFLKTYNEGDYIPPGNEIMKIIPNKRENYYVELYIKNKDILRIDKDDLIRYRIASYPYKEFGIAKGRILMINSDTTEVDNQNYVYKIEASINDYLSKGENLININYKNGMITKASVLVGKRKIFYYILEKLDFIN
ncbi:MAG: HlyD family efflux transporter periplasmic adaptor subunit [Halanaerobiales bacterium]